MVVTNGQINGQVNKVAMLPIKRFSIPGRFKDDFPGIEGVVAGFTPNGDSCLALFANNEYSEINIFPASDFKKMDNLTVDMYLAGVIVTSRRTYAQS